MNNIIESIEKTNNSDEIKNIIWYNLKRIIRLLSIKYFFSKNSYKKWSIIKFMAFLYSISFDNWTKLENQINYLIYKFIRNI